MCESNICYSSVRSVLFGASGATRISFRRGQSSGSGSLQTQSGPLKSQNGPYKARAGPFKARTGPPRPERAPLRPERALANPERAPLKPERVPPKPERTPQKTERTPPDISEGSADPFDPPPPGCATVWSAYPPRQPSPSPTPLSQWPSPGAHPGRDRRPTVPLRIKY